MAVNRLKKSSKRRALVVGISGYSKPLNKLPGVANDVREMAKLLGSKNGLFSSKSVEIVSEKSATRQSIMESLNKTFLDSNADDTVFVYLAGHGGSVDSEYYFFPYDIDATDIATSGVHLKVIKSLFERCKSSRVFLWLDFCQSGGILRRRSAIGDMDVIRRSLNVVKGQGRVIVAACTESQFAIEDPAIGHGLFTHALLKGLNGEAKSASGEVTAASLFDFIDGQINRNDQRPVFFGEMQGRIVLMNYATRDISDESVEPSQTAIGDSHGTWVMIGDDFFLAKRVWDDSDRLISVEIPVIDGESEAKLADLRAKDIHRRRQVSFAANNDAFEASVESVTSEQQGTKRSFTVRCRRIPQQPSWMHEMTVNGIGPDEIARRRAGRILLNDPPPATSRNFGTDATLEHQLGRFRGRQQNLECVVRQVHRNFGTRKHWREIARLLCIYELKITGTVEHVFELKIGTVKSQAVQVSFRGQRPRKYDNQDPVVLEIRGTCPLSQ